MSSCSDNALDARGPRTRPFSGGATRADVIGPNAMTRMAQALTAEGGDPVCRHVFAAAGLDQYLDNPPTRMVEAREAARLHRELLESLGPVIAARVSLEAGRLTGDYLLANRIPRQAQSILRLLPRGISARLLARAIARHAWTFTGRGTFSYSFTPRLILKITESPVCRELHVGDPVCHYLAATFQRIFIAALGTDVRVIETECEAAGAPACLFDVSWH